MEKNTTPGRRSGYRESKLHVPHAHRSMILPGDDFKVGDNLVFSLTKGGHFDSGLYPARRGGAAVWRRFPSKRPDWLFERAIFSRLHRGAGDVT